MRTTTNILLAVLLIGAVVFDVQMAYSNSTGFILLMAVMLSLGVYFMYTTHNKEGESPPNVVIAARMAIGLISIAVVTQVAHALPYGKWLIGLSSAWYLASSVMYLKTKKWGFSFTTYLPVFAAGMSLAIGNHWLSPLAIFALMFAGNVLAIIGMDIGRRQMSWAGVCILWITGIIIATTP